MIVLKMKNYEIDLLSTPNAIASTTECTGLIQIPPTSEEEAEAYGDIYVIPEQVNDFSNVKKPKGREIKSAPDVKTER